MNLLQLALESIEERPGDRVQALRLKIGALSVIHEESLRFSFSMVAEGTRLEGAELKIETLPVKIYCPQCCEEVVLASIQSFRCPVCATASADIRQGRELDLEAIELFEEVS